MDARPRQLLIAFLSTEIGCKLRKLRPTQTRGLLDEFYSPPPCTTLEKVTAGPAARSLAALLGYYDYNDHAL